MPSPPTINQSPARTLVGADLLIEGQHFGTAQMRDGYF